MPSHNIAYLKYTPIALFEYIQLERLFPIEISILFYIVEKTYNFLPEKFDKISPPRQWKAVFSYSEMATHLMCEKMAVSRAVHTLIKRGVIESEEIIVRTSGGGQKSRQYRLADTQKINEICDLIRRTNSPKGVSLRTTPKNVDNSQGVSLRTTPLPLQRYTFATSTIHLCHFNDTPSIDMALKFKRNPDAKELLINIKEFLKKFGEFQYSYFQLYKFEARTVRTQRVISVQIGALIRQYGLFFTHVGMTTHLFSKDAHLVNLELIEDIIQTNENELKEKWSNLLKQVEKLYIALSEYEILCIEKKLEFKTQSVLFLESKKDNDNVLSLYNSFIQDSISIYELASSQEQFLGFMESKINLYYKSKILGHHEPDINYRET